MLHPRLPWLCDWELCRFPALMLSSEGEPAVWRKHLMLCDYAVRMLPELLPP